MKQGKLKKQEADLQSCPSVTFKVLAMSSSTNSQGSTSKTGDHKLPRRIITSSPVAARSGSGSSNKPRVQQPQLLQQQLSANSDNESVVSRYSLFSNRSSRRRNQPHSNGHSHNSSNHYNNNSDNMSVTTSRTKILFRRAGCSCCYVPGHIIVGVMLFSVLTLWHHTNYFTPNSYLSPYISAMRDVTAETAQGLYSPSSSSGSGGADNPKHAILQAMDLKSDAEPDGMHLPHPNSNEMREFLRRAQSSTQKDMIRMEIMGESSSSSAENNNVKRKKRDVRSMKRYDNGKDEGGVDEEGERGRKKRGDEDESAEEGDPPKSKRNRKKQTEDEDTNTNSEETSQSRRSSKKKSEEDEDQTSSSDNDSSSNNNNSRKKKRLRSNNVEGGGDSRREEEPEDSETPPTRKKKVKKNVSEEEEADQTTESDSSSSKGKGPSRDAVPPPTKSDAVPTTILTMEQENFLAHTMSDDPCTTIITTIDPVKGILQKKIPLLSCPK